MAEPAVDRERVRAGVDDPALLVDAQEAVADPRGVGVVAALPRDREVAAGDHLGQVGGGLEVGQLQPARGADAEQVGVAADHGDHPPAAADRDGLGADRDVVAPLRVALPDQPALGVRDVEVGPPAGRRRRCRRCRRRTPWGRWWAASGRRPRSRCPRGPGSHSTRSAKLRSAMICQSACSSWSQATSSASRSVWARTSSIRDATQVSVGVAPMVLTAQAHPARQDKTALTARRHGMLWQDGRHARAVLEAGSRFRTGRPSGPAARRPHRRADPHARRHRSRGARRDGLPDAGDLGGSRGLRRPALGPRRRDGGRARRRPGRAATPTRSSGAASPR